MILLIDNYDSFSYNLYQLIGSLDPAIEVVRNDVLSVEEVEKKKPDAIILSPGPGIPEDAGICIEVVKKLGGKIPILGVCLGHQAIVTAFGGEVSHAKHLMHGKQSKTKIDSASLIFRHLGEEIQVARYHSLSAVEEKMPSCLKIIARADDGEIMAVEHEKAPIYGLQFHPESILTPDGMVILRNFLNMAQLE